MAYALIPEGFELKQVTKLQQQAVDEYFGRERKGTYIDGILSNPNTPIVVGGLVAGFLGVRLADAIIEDLETRVGKLADDVKQGIKDTIDIKLPTFGAPAPTAPTISDLIKYLQEQV